MELKLPGDDLEQCVSCGLCLPHCPTYRVTGLESRSPRGRIAVMAMLAAGEAEPDQSVVDSIDSCVQCRGCEPACPSGVRFGSLMTATRDALEPTLVPRWQRAALATLGHHRMLTALATAAGALQRVGLPTRGVSKVPLRRRRLDLADSPSGTGEPVWLTTGCVMDVVQREVHRATVTVLEHAGAEVLRPTTHEGCCGALAAHAGSESLARSQVTSFEASFRDALDSDAPIVSNAAGCGAHLKSVMPGHVIDVHEWLAERLDQLRVPEGPKPTIVMQEPCHLRHVQHSEAAFTEVLDHFFDVRTTDDAGLCCGAGGAFAVVHPAEAVEIRDRKVDALVRAGADRWSVVTANPGCQLHLAAGGLDVRHSMELIAGRIDSIRPR
jgi:glycolate oxidase iron-sulfur subunit